MTIKKCTCGCENFTIVETLVHKASINQETGALEAYKNQSNEIEVINCYRCGEEYSVNDFKDIEFNY